MPIPRALRAIGAFALTPRHDTLSDEAHAASLIDRRTAWRGLAVPAALAVARSASLAQAAGGCEGEFEHGAALPGAPGGPVCGVTRKLQLRLGFERVVVHIAREVTGDRCLYGEVYQHESRHVAADRALLAEYAPRVTVVMNAAVAAIGVVRGDSPDAVARAIHQHVQAAFTAEFNAVEQERDRHQRLVDQPEEYRRISEACGGGAARLVGAIRRPLSRPSRPRPCVRPRAA